MYILYINRSLSEKDESGNFAIIIMDDDLFEQLKSTMSKQQARVYVVIWRGKAYLYTLHLNTIITKPLTAYIICQTPIQYLVFEQ